MSALLTVDSPSVTYPTNLNLLNIYDRIAAQTIVAYPNASNVPQTLALGASDSITLTSANDIRFYSESNVNNPLTTFSFPDASTTQFTTFTNDFRLIANDNLDTHQYHIGSLTTRQTADHCIIETQTKPKGLYVNNDFTVDGHADFNSSASFYGSVFCSDNHYAQNYNLFKTFNPLLHPTSATMTGYAFTINSNDQLELVRYNKFYDGTNVTTRVAVFGSGQLTQNDSSDFHYVAFDEINGLSVVQGSNAQPVLSNNANLDNSEQFIVLRNTVLGLSNTSIQTVASLDTLTSRFNTLSNYQSNQVNPLLASHTSQLSSHYAYLSNLDTLTTTHTSDISLLTTAVLDLRNGSNGLSADITNLQENTNASFGSVAQSLSALSASNQTQSNQILTLSTTASLQAARITGIETNIDLLQDDLQQVQNSITSNVDLSIQELTDFLDQTDLKLYALSNYTHQTLSNDLYDHIAYFDTVFQPDLQESLTTITQSNVEILAAQNKQSVYTTFPFQSAYDANSADTSIPWDPASPSNNANYVQQITTSQFTNTHSLPLYVIVDLTAPGIVWRFRTYDAYDQPISSHLFCGSHAHHAFLAPDQSFRIHYADINTVTSLDMHLSITQMPFA